MKTVYEANCYMVFLFPIQKRKRIFNKLLMKSFLDPFFSLFFNVLKFGGFNNRIIQNKKIKNTYNLYTWWWLDVTFFVFGCSTTRRGLFSVDFLKYLFFFWHLEPKFTVKVDFLIYFAYLKCGNKINELLLATNNPVQQAKPAVPASKHVNRIL